MIQAALFSGRPLQPERFSRPLYDLLDGWRDTPYRFSDVEPVRQPWGSRDEFLRQCEHNSRQPFGTVIVKWQRPQCYLMLIFERGPLSQSHVLTMRLRQGVGVGGESIPWVLGLLDALLDLLEMDYGFACLEDEFRSLNRPAASTDGTGGNQSTHALGPKWPDCIPGLFWCNYFGNAYFDQGFGPRIMELSGASSLRRGFRVLRSPSPVTWESEEDQIRSEQVRTILGVEWFCSCQDSKHLKSLKTDKSAFCI